MLTSLNKLSLVTKEARNSLHSNWRIVLFSPQLKIMSQHSIIELLRTPKGTLIALLLIKWAMSMVYDRRVVVIDKAALTSNLGRTIYYRQVLMKACWFTNLLYRRHKAVINWHRSSKIGRPATRAWTSKPQLCKYLKQRVLYYRISQTQAVVELKPTLQV